jgi:hypothetical protein
MLVIAESLRGALIGLKMHESPALSGRGTKSTGVFSWRRSGLNKDHFYCGIDTVAPERGIAKWLAIDDLMLDNASFGTLIGR